VLGRWRVRVVDDARILFVVPTLRRMLADPHVGKRTRAALVLGQPPSFRPDGGPEASPPAVAMGQQHRRGDRRTRTVRSRVEWNAAAGLRDGAFRSGKIISPHEEAGPWSCPASGPVGGTATSFVATKDYLREGAPGGSPRGPSARREGRAKHRYHQPSCCPATGRGPGQRRAAGGTAEEQPGEG